MALSVLPLQNIMIRQFSSSANSDRFTSDFLDAINNALNDIWATGALDTEPSKVTSVSGSISQLSNAHSSAFQKGLVYHLTRLGQKHSGVDYVIAKQEWEDALGDIMVIERRDWQSDEDDDGQPTEDVVGLGHVGD